MKLLSKISPARARGLLLNLRIQEPGASRTLRAVPSAGKRFPRLFKPPKC
jgi:hypothetical protein